MVKEYFSLADAKVSPEVVENTTEGVVIKEAFGMIKTADGSVELHYPGEELTVGTELTIVDAEGNTIPAPAGEHLLENGERVVLDEEGKITEFLTAAPAEGESAEAMANCDTDMAEMEEDDKMMVDKMEEVKEEIIEEVMEEEAPAMDIAPIVDAVIAGVMEELKKEMDYMKEKMAQVETEVEEKVEAFAKAPASGRTIPGTPVKGETLKAPENVFNAERWNQVMARIKK